MTSTEAMTAAAEMAAEVDGPGDSSAADAQVDVSDNHVNGIAHDQGVELSKAPKKLYFLRLPKPDLSDKQLEKARLDSEVAQYRDACDRALAAAKLANEHRYQRREEYQTAFAQFGVSKADRDSLLQRLRPMRDENRQASEKRQQVNAQKAQLPAATTAELERKIAELEQKQAHETMDRKSENALIADIRRLAKSRAAVARFEADNPRIEVSKEERESMNMSKTELEGQLKIVQEEYTLAKAQMDERWTLLQEARSSQEEVSNEFGRLKDLKDAKYKERSALRDELQAAANQFYENRRFSQKVRTFVSAGDLDQAVELCAEETESLLSDLLVNQEAYTEYVSSWDLQRAHAVSEAPIDVSRAAPATAQSKTNGAASKMTADADAIVQGIMAELAGRGPAPAAADALARALPAPVAKAPKAPKAPKAAAEPVVPAAPPPSKAVERVLAQSKPATAPAPAPAPSAPRSKAAPAPALDDTFVPPVAAAPAKPLLTDAQIKAKVRQEQAAKAAEAEERKRKKEEAKTKKAEQAKEAARLKAEAEEQKQASDKARIDREAQKQREGAAKKKELEARRKAKAEEKSKTIKARSGAKAVPVSKAPRKKATPLKPLYDALKKNQVAVYCVGVIVCLLVFWLALR